MRTSRSDKRPCVLVTMGDPSGVGPEVIVKSLRQNPKLIKRCTIVGDSFVLSKVSRSLGVRLDLDLIDLANVPRSNFSYGKSDRSYGSSALEYIDAALGILSAGKAKALVTAPVNKASIALGCAKFTGHTEYLAGKTRARRFAMMLMGGPLKVTLVTRHIALKDVSRRLSVEGIRDAVELTCEALRKNFSIRSPRIGVAGLNPHAGEGGLMGHEEENVIRPAIESASKNIRNIVGPRPPDVIFREALQGRYDAVVAMYHDQGLTALKMLYFDRGVNLTLGLPFIRTSPDHGSAFDIAGRWRANPRSMIEALKLAIRFAGDYSATQF